MLDRPWVVIWEGRDGRFGGDSRPMPFAQALRLASEPRNCRNLVAYWIEPYLPEPNRPRASTQTSTPNSKDSRDHEEPNWP